MEHLRLLEERRLQEENIKLQEMEENERIEYLHKKQEEEDARKREAEEQRKREEEAALLAAEKTKVEEELLARSDDLMKCSLKESVWWAISIFVFCFLKGDGAVASEVVL